MRHPFSLRPGERTDAVAVAALSVQVFLDTYATDGVRLDLAREAFREYSMEAFVIRLVDADRRFVLAEAQSGLIGFAEVGVVASEAAVKGLRGCELIRLYVQPQAQRVGVGTALLEAAETIATNVGAPHLWLSVWEGNARGQAFYARMGYADCGETV